jgi:hypothetical protein
LPVPQWTRIARVGTPEVELRPEIGPSKINVTFNTKPHKPEGWMEYFKEKAQRLGIQAGFDSSGMDGDVGYVSANETDLERVVAAIDEAIEYANDRYEANVIPALQAQENRRAEEAHIAMERQAALDQRAAKLAKPDPDQVSRTENDRNG